MVARRRRPGFAARRPQRGGTTLPSTGAASQTVWNDCESFGNDSCAMRLNSAGLLANGAGGGGYSAVSGQRPSYQPGTNTHRAVPDISYPSDPSSGAVAAFWNGGWGAIGGTSVAPPTNAGLFADTNQGCARSLGMVAPALYAAGGLGNANFTDVTAGNNDFTQTERQPVLRPHRVRRRQRPGHAGGPEPVAGTAGRGRLSRRWPR